MIPSCGIEMLCELGKQEKRYYRNKYLPFFNAIKKRSKKDNVFPAKKCGK
jgi:hypothetical protein